MFEYSPPLEPWLDILFKDKDIMVVNKPTGLLSVPGRGPENEDSVLHRVKQQHPKAAAAHRLDMATTGVLVIPLNPNSHRELSRQFRERETEKHYLAWVWGEPELDAGEVESLGYLKKGGSFRTKVPPRITTLFLVFNCPFFVLPGQRK